MVLGLNYHMLNSRVTLTQLAILNTSNLPGGCCICLEQSAGVSTGIAVTASFSQQTEDRAFCLPGRTAALTKSVSLH